MKVKQYIPLFVLVLVACLGAGAIVYGTRESLFEWMHFFMGFFFCQFAMLKLFHLAGFAEGFQKYDLVAKKFPFYAYVYPFIELLLGLCYLSFIYQEVTYSFTVLVMGVSAVGVIKALKSGLNLKCACMGTVLDVPLSTVTLSEDIVMGGMALLMLL